MVCKCGLLFSLIPLFLLTSFTEGHITIIDHTNFDKLADGRSFLVVLFYSEGCKACDKAVKELDDAAKQFKDVDEVIFGKIDVYQDRVLALRFNIKDVPIISFFPYKKIPLPFLQAITSENIVGAVSASRLEGRLYRGVHMNEHLLGQHFTDIHVKMNAREIKIDDFKTEVLSNKKYVLLALFAEGCKEECLIFDMVNNVFREDENIALLKLNVANARELVNHYKMTHNPTLIWFPVEDKKFGKIYGGQITFRMLISFINSETGAERAPDGRIKEDAGRIQEFDDYLEKHAIDLTTSRNLKRIFDGLKMIKNKVKAPKRFVDYYMKILEESVSHRTIDQVLEAENEYITKRLSKKKLSTKERDEWTKFRNIISGIVDMVAKKMQEVRMRDFKRQQEFLEKERVETHKKKVKEMEEDVYVKTVKKQPVEWVTHSVHDEL